MKTFAKGLQVSAKISVGLDWQTGGTDLLLAPAQAFPGRELILGGKESGMESRVHRKGTLALTRV